MPFKILVVEDNADTRHMLHFYFTNVGYSVPTAVDGLKGLYMAKAEKPDLILTDFSMPEMDGIEMVKHIRSEPETAKIPILIFTAHSSLTLEEAIEAGANQVFYKPVDFDKLINVVREMLNQSNDE
jgi:two-component system alkaline phosphatase synthesis response regulator PhoP